MRPARMMKNKVGTQKSNSVEGQPLGLKEAVLFLVFGYFLVPRGIGALAWQVVGNSAQAVNCNLLVTVVVDCLVLAIAWHRLRKDPGVKGSKPSYPAAFPVHSLDLPSVLRILAMALFGFDAANGLSILVTQAMGSGISSLTMAAYTGGAGTMAAFTGGARTMAAFAAGTSDTLGASDAGTATVEMNVFLGILAIGIVIPIFEEVLIRGILYRGLRSRCGFWKAAVLSSAIWGASHLNLQTAMATFFAGLLLTVVYEKYGKLWLPMVLHMANNMLALPALEQYLPRINTPDTVGATWILLIAEILIAGWLCKRVIDSGGPHDRKSPNYDV